ncbi:MAG: sodium-dependent transporter, family [Francisellaceae bacterium]|nr:sodium-dependent transporter, family [Francisellaceae bacterium]
MSTTTAIFKKEQWSSRFAFIMATTGAAVGLGNIWKFPYMAGENGGGAFVFVYLVFILLVGIPTMMGEILIGKLGKANPVNTFKTLSEKYRYSPWWQMVGWWGALGLVLVLSFYSVVAGWSIAYFVKACRGELTQISPIAIQQIWYKFLLDPKALLLYHSIFILITLWVVANGLKKGIERVSSLLMPCLFFVLIALMLYSSITGDFMKALTFLLKPNFSKINFSVIIYALGHAFFTLAIGAGAMLIYGSYLPAKTRIASSVCVIAFLDVLVAICSGLAIFSLVFSNNLSPESGPGLMFKILPIAFSYMPWGRGIGALFFILLWFAAWASALSMAEPLVVLFSERFNWSRIKSSITVGLICWFFGIGALLSFNVFADFKLFNKYTLFDAMADLATNIILPIGVLAIAIFAGYKLPNKVSKKGLLIYSSFWYKVWRFLIRKVAPCGIVIVFLGNLF